MATQENDLLMTSVMEMVVSETESTEAAYGSGSTDTTFIQTAVANVPYPKLQKTAIYHWEICGQLFQPTSTQTYEVQVVIDGAPVSGVMTFVNPTFFAGGGSFTLEVKVMNLASNIGNKETQQAIRATMTISNSAAAHVVTLESSSGMLVDTNLSHTMNLQIRKQLATANHFITLHSQVCHRRGGKSGS